jgi:hypothetical protein
MFLLSVAGKWVYKFCIYRNLSIANLYILLHCATSRNVAGSISDGVSDIFHWLNISDRNMHWGRLSLSSDISTKDLPLEGGVGVGGKGD